MKVKVLIAFGKQEKGAIIEIASGEIAEKLLKKGVVTKKIDKDIEPKKIDKDIVKKQ